MFYLLRFALFHFNGITLKADDSEFGERNLPLNGDKKENEWSSPTPAHRQAGTPPPSEGEGKGEGGLQLG